jgi:hypothetical protein
MCCISISERNSCKSKSSCELNRRILDDAAGKYRKIKPNQLMLISYQSDTIQIR